MTRILLSIALALPVGFGTLSTATAQSATAQSANPPALATPPKIDSSESRVFASEPVLLREQGAGEGPAWHPDLGLLTSGPDRNIHRRHPDGSSSIFMENAGSNGLMFDRSGQLIICQPVRRRVIRYQIDGPTSVLAETFSGMRFNQPNDATMDSRNRIYFSDPCYGDRSQMEMLDEKSKTVEGVYRIDPDGKVTRVIGRQVERANGLVVTADDKYLFVADNNNSEGGSRKLFRFELTAEGQVNLESQKLIYDWSTTRGPDGMKLDQQGNLYVAAGLNKQNPPDETATGPTAGIYVFSPAGKLIDFAAIPRDETTNCAFGDKDLKTLYVTAGGTLWSIRTKYAGAPVWPKPAP